MISRISGTIVDTSIKAVIIDVGGVGYNIYVTPDTIATIENGNMPSITLWTHLAVRENSMELFGFPVRDELDFFEMLIDVSGIGPRGALGIIGIGSIDTLKNAIASGNSGYLTKVSGIGRKTAEKIIIELRDKLAARGHSAEKGSLRAESDALEALLSLGYSQQEARSALSEVSGDVNNTSTRVKEALKILGGK